MKGRGFLGYLSVPWAYHGSGFKLVYKREWWRKYLGFTEIGIVSPLVV